MSAAVMMIVIDLTARWKRRTKSESQNSFKWKEDMIFRNKMENISNYQITSKFE